MNRVFVSLRQACCRDSGQLGTPCRLKIMELVELRAMGWKPTLSHSQYYLNRGSSKTTDSVPPPPSTLATSMNNLSHGQTPPSYVMSAQAPHTTDFEHANAILTGIGDG